MNVPVPIPFDDGEPVESLRNLEIPETAQKESFDRITHVANARFRGVADPDGDAAGAISPPLAIPSAKVRILLAEDNAINQRVATFMLRKLGYDLDIAANGKEAVEVWKRGAYPIILMDCQMPELDGMEATREIRRLEGPVRKTVIVALTASALAEDCQCCLDAGMDDYIAKPVGPETLQRKIEQWLATAAPIPA